MFTGKLLQRLAAQNALEKIYECIIMQCFWKVKEAETRLAGAKRANSRQQAIFQELKSSGGGVAELNRENINKYE